MMPRRLHSDTISSILYLTSNGTGKVNSALAFASVDASVEDDEDASFLSLSVVVEK